MIQITGRIGFDPPSKTKKQKEQDEWKRLAMVHIHSDDIIKYYSWFFEKRYNIRLNPPMRGAHITFISDSLRDLTKDFTLDRDKTELLWDKVKNKWDGKEVTFRLDLDVRSNGRTWWLNVVEEDRAVLQEVRNELGLGRPYFGMHMSIGYANPKDLDHSKYVLKSIIEHGRNFE